jgi:hypothetical protein
MSPRVLEDPPTREETEQSEERAARQLEDAATQNRYRGRIAELVAADDAHRLDALRQRAGWLISKGYAYEDENHDLRLTRQGIRVLSKTAPELLQAILARHGVKA